MYIGIYYLIFNGKTFNLCYTSIFTNLLRIFERFGTFVKTKNIKPGNLANKPHLN